MVLSGGEGIGKSTLLGVLAAECGSGGSRVLRCGLSEAERGLPLLGLIDLFGDVEEEVFGGLSRRERGVLETVLLRDDSREGEGDVLALRMAVLALFRELAARSPVLVVVDDVQWLDERTADLLRFAARRTRGFRHMVRALAAERTEPGREPRTGGAVLRLRVPGMDVEETGVLLAGTLGVGWAAPLVRRVHSASGGNPYFALELGRAIAERGEQRADEPLPLPASLRGRTARRLDGCSPAVRRMLLT
ncbi:AAA family ATPase, partial [Actinocorallia lasiicapitis]